MPNSRNLLTVHKSHCYTQAFCEKQAHCVKAKEIRNIKVAEKITMQLCTKIIKIQFSICLAQITSNSNMFLADKIHYSSYITITC
jgi:hypothetical protein